MSITKVQATSSYPSSNGSKAFVSNNTAGNLIAVYVHDGNASNSVSIGDPTVSDSQGNTYIQAGTRAWDGTHTGHNTTAGWWFYVKNCKAGANTITVTRGSNGQDMSFHISEWNSTVGTLDLVTTSQNTSAGTPTSAISTASLVTTTEAVILQGFGNGGGIGAITPGTRFSALTSEAGNPSFTEYDIETSGGTYTCTATAGSTCDWTISAVAFSASSSGNTATGAFASQTATTSGSVKLTRIATGAFASQVATVAGTCTTTRKVTGAFAAQAATMAGTCTTTRKATGSFASQAATVSGTAKLTNRVTGAFAAQRASVAATCTTTRKATGAFSSQAATVAGAVTVAGLKAYWKFDETGTATTAADSSGNGNDATLHTTTGFPWNSSGKHNGCVALSGDGKNFSADSVSPSLDGSFTLSMWVKDPVFYAPDSRTDYLCLADASSRNDVRLSTANQVDTAFHLLFVSDTPQINEAGGGPATTTTTWTAGQWYHICATYNTNTGVAKIYVNGSLEGTKTVTRDNSVKSRMFNLFVEPGGDHPVRASCDEIKVFNYDLSSTEVSALAGEFGSNTASGAFNSQVATIAGSAKQTRIITGAMASQGASIAGSASSLKTVTGAFHSQVATIAGSAKSSRILTGALSAQSGRISGTASTPRVIMGALSAQSSSMVGSIKTTRIVAGAMAAQHASITGSTKQTRIVTGSMTVQQSRMNGFAGKYKLSGNQSRKIYIGVYIGI